MGKRFFSFVNKEFMHILRDRRTVLILLVMPIVQIIIFGFAITTEVNNARFAVLNPNKDITTQKIIDRIDASEYFELAKVIDSPNDIDEIFRTLEVDLLVVFDENFTQTLLHSNRADIHLVSDATDPNTSTTLVNYASSIINEYQMELMELSGVPYQISPKIKLLYNPQMRSAYNFVPGVMGLILTLICAMMTAISIAKEKETGTMEVLLVSPMKPIFIILAKVVPYFVLSCVNIVTILLLSVYVLDVPVSGSLTLLSFASIVFVFVSLSFGLLISTVAKTQVTAMIVSGMMLMMPVMLLSGMMFPTEDMPLLLEMFSHIIPAKWYIIVVKKVMIQGLGWEYILKEIFILFMMALALIIISLKNFKTRLE